MQNTQKSEIQNPEIQKQLNQMMDDIRQNRPLVHCITNVVTVNDCANILLAVGASPTMAHHPAEAAEVTAGCKSLVINLGATESFRAAQEAAIQADQLSHPIVIDPVGIGGSTYRREFLQELLQKVHPACIRGNVSEMQALLTNRATVTGVDAMDVNTEHTGKDNTGSLAIDRKKLQKMAETFAMQHSCILMISGEVDFLTDGRQSWQVANGSCMMSRITGTGCMLSALLGAFLSQENSVTAAVCACGFMGICGENAAEQTKTACGGTMTFRDKLIDSASMWNGEQTGKLHVLQQR